MIETLRKLISGFETKDVYAIAEQSSVKIIYGSWHPVTAGEFDKKTRTICVNRQALENNRFSEQEIIAHELGHFFALNFAFNRTDEENFACEFAKVLLEK